MAGRDEHQRPTTTTTTTTTTAVGARFAPALLAWLRQGTTPVGVASPESLHNFFDRRYASHAPPKRRRRLAPPPTNNASSRAAHAAAAADRDDRNRDNHDRHHDHGDRTFGRRRALRIKKTINKKGNTKNKKADQSLTRLPPRGPHAKAAAPNVVGVIVPTTTLREAWS